MERRDWDKVSGEGVLLLDHYDEMAGMLADSFWRRASRGP
jgi:hypothetical protein